ncbi:hypothetical protein MT_57026 [Pseudomonas phage phiPto-bp6g]|nr:hypothetical protein MT_57026 [Pseudomonas phage phiPto-bp6g]
MNLVKHLLSRNYDPTRYVNQVLDIENSVLTVYLTNLAGQIVGFQQYRPLVTSKKLNDPRDARYFTYYQRGVNACWGLETIDPSKKDLYLVEGIFKASALHMLGYNALALLTSNPKPMKSWLHTLNHNLIGIGDNDKAGKGMIRIAGDGFQSEKDLDEYTLIELESVINNWRKHDE